MEISSSYNFFTCTQKIDVLVLVNVFYLKLKHKLKPKNMSGKTLLESK